MHYRARGPIGFLKVKAVVRSRHLLLIKKNLPDKKFCNYLDDYEIEWELPGSLELQLSQSVFALQPGVYTDIGIIYVVEDGLPAGFELTPTIRLMTSDGIEMGSISTTIEVAVLCDWEMHSE